MPDTMDFNFIKILHNAFVLPILRWFISVVLTMMFLDSDKTQTKTPVQPDGRNREELGMSGALESPWVGG